MAKSTNVVEGKLLVEEVNDRINDLTLLVDCEEVDAYVKVITDNLEELTEYLSMLKERENELRGIYS